MVLHKPYWAISSAWFLAWQEFACNEGAPPGPIENGLLVAGYEPGSQRVLVRSDLVPEHDFVFVGAQAWMRLQAWHGGGPAVMRKAVRLDTGYTVEMFPVELRYEMEGKMHAMFLSSSNRLKMVRHWLATSLNCPPHRCDLLLITEPVLPGQMRERRRFSSAELRHTVAEMGIRGTAVMEVVVRSDHAALFQREHEREHELEHWLDGHHPPPPPPDNPRSPKRLLSSISRLVCCPYRLLQAVDEQCLVCMDLFGPESIVRQLQCKHVFCDPCILQWFGHSNHCPKCRSDITK